MYKTLNIPINSLSFGGVSIGLLREIKKRGGSPNIFLIGQSDISTQKPDKEFNEWLKVCCDESRITAEHDRKSPTFKLWHLKDSLSCISREQTLLTFYELDQPTRQEINIANNQKDVIVTSEYTRGVLSDHGVKRVSKVPLFFDSHNFHRIEKQYFRDDRIVFNICGKLEKRKHQAKAIKAWAKKFGNDRRYYLQCALNNVFLRKDGKDLNEQFQNQILGSDEYFNVRYFPFCRTNADYNDFLNSGDIILGVSGAEGWGLPEFTSIALGKHAVILDAHAYKEWATPENSTLISPMGKIEVYDDIFFKKGRLENQGNIFDWNEEEFIDACEKTIEKVRLNKKNEEGMKLQEQFTVEKTLDGINQFA